MYTGLRLLQAVVAREVQRGTAKLPLGCPPARELLVHPPPRTLQNYPKGPGLNVAHIVSFCTLGSPRFTDRFLLSIQQAVKRTKHMGREKPRYSIAVSCCVTDISDTYAGDVTTHLKHLRH